MTSCGLRSSGCRCAHDHGQGGVRRLHDALERQCRLFAQDRRERDHAGQESRVGVARLADLRPGVINAIARRARCSRKRGAAAIASPCRPRRRRPTCAAPAVCVPTTSRQCRQRSTRQPRVSSAGQSWPVVHRRRASAGDRSRPQATWWAWGASGAREPGPSG